MLHWFVIKHNIIGGDQVFFAILKVLKLAYPVRQLPVETHRAVRSRSLHFLRFGNLFVKAYIDKAFLIKESLVSLADHFLYSCLETETSLRLDERHPWR